MAAPWPTSATLAISQTMAWERFPELSHTEGFVERLRTQGNQLGFCLMDEPDAPLSVTACLGPAGFLHDLAQVGSQAVVATH